MASSNSWSVDGHQPKLIGADLINYGHRRRAGDLDGLVHHSDRGIQYLCVRYSERLAENEIVASVGSKGDSFDNAMVESFNGSSEISGV